MIRYPTRAFSKSVNASNVRLFSFAAATVEVPHKVGGVAKGFEVGFQKEVLPNAATLYARNSNSNAFSVTFAILRGSGAESAESRGATHYISSTSFGVNTQHTRAYDLVYNFETEGLEYSSSADREKITWTVKGDKAFFKEGVSRIAEIIFQAQSKPLFRFKEALSFAEFDYANKDHAPHVALSELLHEAAFGEGTQFGSSLFARNLYSLDFDAIVDFRNKNYPLGDNVVVFADGVDLKTAKESLQNAFPQLSEADKEKLGAERAEINSPFSGGEVRQKADIHGDSYAALAFPVPSGPSSRAYLVLSQILQDKFPSAFFVPYSSQSLLGLYFHGSPAEVSANITSAVQTLKSIASGSGFQSRIKKASLSNFIQYENDSVSTALTSTVLGLKPSEYCDLRNVTDNDVVKAAQTLLKSNPALAVLGETTGVVRLDAIKKLL